MKSLWGIGKPLPWWRSILFWGGMLVAGFLLWVRFDAVGLASCDEAMMIRLNREPPQTLIVDQAGYRYYPGQVMGFNPGGGPCGGGSYSHDTHAIAGAPWLEFEQGLGPRVVMGGFRAEWVFPHYYVISMWLALLGLVMMWRWVILQRLGMRRGR